MAVAALNKSGTHGPIGLDIAESGLRLVQLRLTDGTLSIHRAAVWTRGSSRAGIDPTQALQERLSRFSRQSGFVGRATVTCLSSPIVESHLLHLPTGDAISEAELQKAAVWEIQRLSTLDKEELQPAIWPLPSARRDAATHMAVAAPRAAVERHLDICTAAGLSCIRVDAAACALAALVWRLRDKPRQEVWGILDLGHQSVRLLICVDDTPVMVRSFEMGGEVWTSHIAAALNLSPEAAERNKREFGIAVVASASTPQTKIKASGGDGGDQLSALIMGLLRDDLQRLSLETERSYEYALQCYHPRTPGDLVMVGGGALLKNLDEYLAAQLGIPVWPVGRCESQEAKTLAEGLPHDTNLETCVLACGLSLQGAADA